MKKKLGLLLILLLGSAFSVSAQQVETVPYMTSFDNTYGEYDGTSFLPKGWLMTGDNPFYTANMNELAAATGTYYLVSQNNTASPRNEHLYTPLFKMEAGRTYEVTYALYMPGLYYAYLDGAGHYAEASHHPTHRLTVGEEQDYEFHTLREPLIVISDSIESGWHRQSALFTPEENGNYCFCLSFESAETYHGDVAVDDFKVTYDGAVLKPTVEFSYGGMFNLMSSSVVDFEGGGIPFRSKMTHTTGCEWKVTDAETGIVVATSTEDHPRFYFPQTGSYKVLLRGYNSEYEAKEEKTLSVEFIGTEGSSFLPIYTYGDESVATVYKPNYTPVIGLESGLDFATGPNHTYRRFAERIEMPENVTLTLNTLQYFLSQCSFASLQSGSVRTIPFTFTLYGETDGLPDDNKVLWTKTVTMGDAFSTNTGGLGSATQLSQPLDGTKVSGTFYVAFEFADEFPIDPWNAGGDRSVIEITSCQHHDDVARMFYKEQSTGEWHRLDYFHPGLAGLGLNLVLWCSANVAASGVENVVLGTTPDHAVYDLQGRRMAQPEHRGIYIQNGRKVVR